MSSPTKLIANTSPRRRISSWISSARRDCSSHQPRKHVHVYMHMHNMYMYMCMCMCMCMFLLCTELPR